MTPEEQESNIKSRQRCLDAFMICKTKEELRISAQILKKIIDKLPEEDKDWLRTMYESCLYSINNPGDPYSTLNAAGKKIYKENLYEE